ncbi:cobalt/nickel transport system permease protein [Acetitomaculum ruminis DSM 5522]|uniref:Cobalt/nickel transport system permease protein n=1 Tax=Acetitomaculum ruminis DSM 5522 TaxID=1120918 RepID=A0A1I1A592_9FIRM|nr:energy-coupling factor transporter transmembrane component T [Acetitomaculum ruminis]SFB31748.1 cobalt/nickel transport system permease protein [Acetitomaculum ruminis DSM 5522]
MDFKLNNTDFDKEKNSLYKVKLNSEMNSKQSMGFNYDTQKLPLWMCKSEDYEATSDKDAFITKSTKALLEVITKIKFTVGKDSRFSASPSLKLVYTLLFIILTAVSRNYMFTMIMGAGVILALAMFPGDVIKNLFSTIMGAVLLSTFILLPAVFMGSPKTLITVTSKVFISVSLIGILSAGTSWNKITRSLKTFFIPNIFIFTLDITIKYVSALGEICINILNSLRLRSIGRNDNKAVAVSGVLGITFLKSREMADELYSAMCCRCFTGEYGTKTHGKTKIILKKQDIFYIFLMISVLVLFRRLG